jgi:hypothetical protein
MVSAGVYRLCLGSATLAEKGIADGIVAVKGICLQLTTDPPIPKVKEWNVEELKVSRSSRFRSSPPLHQSILTLFPSRCLLSALD